MKIKLVEAGGNIPDMWVDAKVCDFSHADPSVNIRNSYLSGECTWREYTTRREYKTQMFEFTIFDTGEVQLWRKGKELANLEVSYRTFCKLARAHFAEEKARTALSK